MNLNLYWTIPLRFSAFPLYIKHVGVFQSCFLQWEVDEMGGEERALLLSVSTSLGRVSRVSSHQSPHLSPLRPVFSEESLPKLSCTGVQFSTGASAQRRVVHPSNVIGVVLRLSCSRHLALKLPI